MAGGYRSRRARLLCSRARRNALRGRSELDDRELGSAGAVDGIRRLGARGLFRPAGSLLPVPLQRRDPLIEAVTAVLLREHLLFELSEPLLRDRRSAGTESDRWQSDQ